MIYRSLDQSYQSQLTQLFADVFTQSESQQEGESVAALVSELALIIDHQDIFCFAGYDEEAQSITAAIFFTRLQFYQDINIFMLSPVAVKTKCQGKGIGQALIQYGLDQLRNHQINTVVTYGDPSFYAKVGFLPLSESVIQAPLPLSMPQGWLGQSLVGETIPAMSDRPACVGPFNDPTLW